MNDRLQKILSKRTRKIIGLMSGMSMDGVDLALAECSGDFPNYSVKLLKSHYLPYSAAMKERLLRGREADLKEVAELNVIVAETFADCVLDFLSKYQIDSAEIDAIGSHGQTIFHMTERGTAKPATLQVGSLSVIAELTQITTVGNFRPRDVAAGGQGAPLVAFTDYVLHAKDEKPLALLNLGSIANITVLGDKLESTVAFDLGPANMLIDHLAKQFYGSLDDNGSISEQGVVIGPMLNELCQLPYFQLPPPKAAGYREFGPGSLEVLLSKYMTHRSQDLVRTAVEFSAWAIADGIGKFVMPKQPKLTRMQVSGGGIYNKTLMLRLRKLLVNLTVESLESQYADSKEALAFAILAHATLSGMPANVPGATGAKHPVVLGEIAI